VNINPYDGAPDPQTPPAGEYTPPQYAYPSLETSQFSPPAANAPLTTQGLFQSYVRVLREPRLATFDAEPPAANWPAVLIGAGAVSVVWASVVMIANLVSPRSAYSATPTFASSLGAFFGVLIVFFVGYFIAMGIYQLIAKMFGGSATFLTYSYALSLAVVPCTVIMGVVLLIPLLGILVVLAGAIYELYLMALATQSAHRVSQGKSWAIVLIPSAVSFLISLLFFFALIALLVLLASAAR
jgi:hypothetical protein